MTRSSARRNRRAGALEPLLPVVVIAMLLDTCAAPDVAGAPADEPRLTVSVGAGAFRPAEEAMRDRYGATHWPWMVQADVRIAGPFSVFAGVRHESRDGETRPEPPVVADERFPIELTSTAVRFGGGVGTRLGHVDVVANIGAERASGTEKWPALGQSYDFSGWGVLLQGAIRVPLWWRVAALGLVEFDHVPVESSVSGAPKIDVGGFTLGAGVSLRF